MMVVEDQERTCYLAKQSWPYILLGTNKYKQTQTFLIGSGYVSHVTNAVQSCVKLCKAV